MISSRTDVCCADHGRARARQVYCTFRLPVLHTCEAASTSQSCLRMNHSGLDPGQVPQVHQLRVELEREKEASASVPACSNRERGRC